jgi:RNA polymerase sigma factor (sigma-70 family)
MADGMPLPTMDELIKQHGPLLYRYAYRLTGNPHEAEDLTQQTYLLVQQHGHQLRDVQALRGWLLTIVRNLFLKSRRHQGRGRSLVEIDEPTVVEESWDSPVDHEQLQQALLELSEEFRSPLVLYYFEDFTYQQIADHMGVPIGTVMSRLSRAKAFLKKKLTVDEETASTASVRTSRSEWLVPRTIMSHG